MKTNSFLGHHWGVSAHTELCCPCWHNAVNVEPVCGEPGANRKSQKPNKERILLCSGDKRRNVVHWEITDRFCWLSASCTYVQECTYRRFVQSMTQFYGMSRAANVCALGSLTGKRVPSSLLFPFYSLCSERLKWSNKFSIWLFSQLGCSRRSHLPLQEITPHSATTANSSTNS